MASRMALTMANRQLQNAGNPRATHLALGPGGWMQMPTGNSGSSTTKQMTVPQNVGWQMGPRGGPPGVPPGGFGQRSFSPFMGFMGMGQYPQQQMPQMQPFMNPFDTYGQGVGYGGGMRQAQDWAQHQVQNLPDPNARPDLFGLQSQPQPFNFGTGNPYMVGAQGQQQNSNPFRNLDPTGLSGLIRLFGGLAHRRGQQGQGNPQMANQQRLQGGQNLMNSGYNGMPVPQDGLVQLMSRPRLY